MSGNLRVLPIAPRPIEGELLSSWQRRVACRYGLSSDELAVMVGAKPHEGRISGFAERDFAPDAGQVHAWAKAARLETEVLQALVLCRGLRPQGCYVWGEGTETEAFRIPVCAACLDDDADAGRDHYIRSTWVSVETVSCTRHDQALIEMCPDCQSSMGWRFKACGQDARVVCVQCTRVLHSRPSPALADSRFLEAMKTLSAGAADEMMRVARLLWIELPWSGGARAPPIARVLTDRPLPSFIEERVDRNEPLATIPLGWRMATLIAVAQLLDLADARRDFGMPPFNLELLMDWTQSSQLRRPMDEALVAPETSLGRLPLRAMVDYRAMADAILSSEEWRQVQGQSMVIRQRMLGQLMTRALDHAPPIRGGALDPVATSRKRRPIAGRRAASAPACRYLAQGEFRVGDGDASDQGHQPVLWGPSW